MSEGEDSPMSDEEEEEDFEEEEVETTDDEGEVDETDSGDDASDVDRTKPNTSRSVKHGSTKTDAKGKAVKRKAEEKVREGKVKKRNTADDVKKVVKTVAAVARKKTEMKRDVKKVDKKADIVDSEVQARSVEPLNADSPGEKNKKSYPTFEDKNLDYDYAANSPSNIIQRRVKIAANIILTCKNVEIVSNGQPVDLASLSFSRKTKNGKAFDYNMPLSLAPVLIKGLQTIIRDNAKFFDSVGKDPN